MSSGDHVRRDIPAWRYALTVSVLIVAIWAAVISADFGLATHLADFGVVFAIFSLCAIPVIPVAGAAASLWLATDFILWIRGGRSNEFVTGLFEQGPGA